jgi:UDP-glucuronate decarboxylase
MRIGIIGHGFVGRATNLLKCDEITTLIYDIKPELCEPKYTTLNDINNCDLVFFCLPTPMNHCGNCYTKLLEDSLLSISNPYKIIRSTVPIGFTSKFSSIFMPEFLTELNWKQDFCESDYYIFGIDNDDNILKERIQQLFDIALKNSLIKTSNLLWTSTKEAETIKLFKNCFLSAKVSIMNELFDLCKKKEVDYTNVIRYMKMDKRIGDTHMNVPGYNGMRGFGGTCFPKDTHSLYSQFQEEQLSSKLFQSVLDRNDNLDRKEREWSSDVWRTTLPHNKPISLVTGGAGFIGSNLCRYLLEQNHIVICLDNFSTGNMNNINSLVTYPNFLIKKADIVEKQFFPHLDYIFHLACPASPVKYQEDGYKTLQTSLMGTMNVLDLCLTHNCKMLFSSTSEIYGDPLEHPQKETYYGNVNTVGPRSCYDEGKRCAETLIYEFRKKHPKLSDKLKIVRIFNTYGPNMSLDDGRIMTNILKSIINNTAITIYGDGSQTRSFCYIEDLIYGIYKMIMSDETGPINLGNPDNEITIKKLVSIFETILGRNLEVEYINLPDDDPKKRNPDITLAIHKLGWCPQIDIYNGISKFIESINRSNPNTEPIIL